MSVARTLAVVRAHWSGENQLHWVVDVVLDEDAARNRKDNGPENLGVLRRLALNLLRLNPVQRAIRRKSSSPDGTTNSSSLSVGADGRVCQHQFDVRNDAALVALQRQHVIAAILQAAAVSLPTDPASRQARARQRSLDLSATATCPSTSRVSKAKPLTMCSGEAPPGRMSDAASYQKKLIPWENITR